VKGLEKMTDVINFEKKKNEKRLRRLGYGPSVLVKLVEEFQRIEEYLRSKGYDPNKIQQEFEEEAKNCTENYKIGESGCCDATKE
jgi:hypothetical protein